MGDDGAAAFVVVFVIGPPYSGKTTLSTRLSDALGCNLASPQKWLQVQRHRPTAFGTYVTNNYSYECLNPLVADYVTMEVNAAKQTQTSLVVDGYPRTAYQAKGLAEMCSDTPFCVLEIGEESLLERRSFDVVLKRAIDRDQWKYAAGRRTMASTHEAVSFQLDAYWTHASELRQYTASSRLLLSEDEAWHRDAGELFAQAAERALGTAAFDTCGGPAGRDCFVAATACESAAIIQFCQDAMSSQLATVGASATTSRRFCGTHPVSLQRVHLSRLIEHPYLVTHKLDGERLLMVVRAGRVWTLRRNFEVSKSVGASATLLQPPHDGTIFDVESCSGGDGGGGGPSYFHVLDCPVLNHLCGDTHVLRRIHASRPVMRELNGGVLSGVVLKPQSYYSRADLRFLHCVAEKGGAKDGLVFTPRSLPYRIGRDSNMYKYKPPHLNTVDLQLFDANTGAGVVLYAKDTSSKEASPPVPFGVLGVAMGDDATREASAMVDRIGFAIVECRPCGGSGGDPRRWEVVHVRTDRCEPNALWVADRVVASIEENITLQELLSMRGVR